MKAFPMELCQRVWFLLEISKDRFKHHSRPPSKKKNGVRLWTRMFAPEVNGWNEDSSKKGQRYGAHVHAASAFWKIKLLHMITKIHFKKTSLHSCFPPCFPPFRIATTYHICKNQPKKKNSSYTNQLPPTPSHPGHPNIGIGNILCQTRGA